MAKIDKKFEYLCLGSGSNLWDFRDKEASTKDSVLYMLDRSSIMFKYHGLPETVPAEELEHILQTGGFTIWGKINGDLYALYGGLGGQGDVYNRPTLATVSVPYLNYNANWEISKDCVVMKNDSAMMGLLPLYRKYCTLMTENEITMILATVNKRLQTLISANDDSTKASAEKFISDLFDGRLGVIAETKLFDSLKTSPATNANTTSLKDLFEFEQYLKASMFNEIGLSANFNMKRERLTANEIEANTDNLYPLVDDMLNQRRTALDSINKMFGTEITVEFNSSWDYRAFQGESIHNTGDEVNPDTDPETDPETDPDTDPETDPDTDPETDPDTDPDTKKKQ